MTDAAPDLRARRLTPEFIATLVIVLAYIVWLLSMPAFPTEDGPIHLYYTDILRALLSHQPTPYARFYVIKHLLPPYALYYYALLGLSRFVSLLLADRIIVCAYILSFVLGFRYLARALGRAADLMTLLATPLLLNWPLGMGFVNFCLSLSFTFWALGLWLRFAGSAAVARRAGFVLLAILAMFTHPVPLLVMLGLTALHLALRTIQQQRLSRTLPPFFAYDLATLLLSTLTLGYVRLFTSTHPLAQTAVGQAPGSFAYRVWQNVLNYAAEKGLVFMAGPGFEARLYRVLILAVFIVPLALAVRQLLRDRDHKRWSAAGTALILAILVLLVLPFVPHDLNGSHFFADRLLLLVWLLPLFSASGCELRPGAGRVALIAFALLSQALILHLANARLRPMADRIAAIDHAPMAIAARPGALGLALEDPREPAVPPGLTFDPSLWAIADVLRHDNAVLANTPWLDLPIIPLGATPALPASTLSSAGLEFPPILRKQLSRDAATRTDLLTAVDFIAVDQIFRAPTAELDPIITSTQGQSGAWTCRITALSWLRVCNKIAR